MYAIGSKGVVGAADRAFDGMVERGVTTDAQDRLEHGSVLGSMLVDSDQRLAVGADVGSFDRLDRGCGGGERRQRKGLFALVFHRGGDGGVEHVEVAEVESRITARG